MTTIGRPVN